MSAHMPDDSVLTVQIVSGRFSSVCIVFFSFEVYISDLKAQHELTNYINILAHSAHNLVSRFTVKQDFYSRF